MGIFSTQRLRGRAEAASRQTVDTGPSGACPVRFAPLPCTSGRIRLTAARSTTLSLISEGKLGLAVGKSPYIPAHPGESTGEIALEGDLG